MARVLTNNTSFAIAREATEIDGARGIGFLPGEDPGDGQGALSGTPVWKQIEPNTISAFGASIETVARNPIRRARGRRKGTLTDLSSSFENDADVTVDSYLDYIEGFMFSRFSNADLIFRAAAAEATGDSYTVPALVAAQVGKLLSNANVDVLLYGLGYTNPANNGVKTLAAQPSVSDTSLTVAEGLVDETPPTNALLMVTGAQFADGEITTAVETARVAGVSARRMTYTFSNISPADLGFSVGEVIFIDIASGNRGFARVADIGSSTLVCDRLDSTLVADGAISGATTQIRYGQFVRDVASDSANFLERSFMVEATFPGLETDAASASPTAAEYEYAKGNYCNTLSWSMPLVNKSTWTASFVGTDTESAVTTQKTGAAAALAPLGTEAFSTSSQFSRLRIMDVDEDGLSTDFKSLDVVISNNVTPEKVLNRIGAAFVNFGNFFVDITASLVFSDAAVIDRIRQNDTVGLDLILENGDGALCVDVPSMTLGDGSRDYPVDATVLVNLSGAAFEDETSGASLGLSFIPSVPA